MHFDLIVIGGGLAGSTLGAALAAHGLRVLILERELAFKDRVRGEGMHPWGVTEAHKLGIYELLLATCAREVLWFDTSSGEHRDLVATTPHRAGFLNFYHPAMQSILLEHAARAGAEIWCGAKVVRVLPGRPPSVVVEQQDKRETHAARLVVGADGRDSAARGWGGFAVQHDPEQIVTVGGLFDGLRVSEDAILSIRKLPAQTNVIMPLGGQRFRTYFAYGKNGAQRPLSGRKHVQEFVAACIGTGAQPEWFEGAELAGPLAAFEGACRWIDHPYRAGVALIGDAAGASDPAFGMGLGLALYDVRTLRDLLLSSDDWDTMAHAYAAEHGRYFGAVHRVENWLTELVYSVGPEADARRAEVAPLHKAEPDRKPDLVGLGPATPSDETARRRFFGEDVKEKSRPAGVQ
jgi:menaquinone-9 beta-reductase